jgi:hypothetical protein
MFVKHWCRQLIDNEKIELAANNGDTLVEAVISAKEQIQIRTAKKISTQKQQPENCTNIIIHHLFQQCFKR